MPDAPQTETINPDAMKPYIAAALEGPLPADQAREAFNIIMSGQATPSQIGGFLMILRHRSESMSEITAAATVMREKAQKVKAPQGAMDIVGTGGDGIGTLNISTATALVVAGAGVVVAKHGNKNLSSKSGAADVLSLSGVNIMIDAPKVQTTLDNAGIAFMMAPMHHPAMKHVMPARQELATRTVFNILGPLTNPASVDRQLTGAFSEALLRSMAEVLQELGTKHAWLVHGLDGTDELSIVAPSKVVETKDGKIREFTITPQDAGLQAHALTDILGGEPEENAARFKALLQGQKDAYRDAVLLNAAAALMIAGKVDDLGSGVKMAERSIDEGAALAKLEMLAKLTNS